MNRFKQGFSLLLAQFLCLPLSVIAAQNYQNVLQSISLPAGFNISLFADNVENARSLALGADGIVYVGTRSAGNVYALQDTDHDGRADKRYLLAEGLEKPNGIAVLNGDLYVAELERLLRWKDAGHQLAQLPKPEVLLRELPPYHRHGWRYLKVGPDNKLYMAIGAPCNVCRKPNPVLATIVSMNAEAGEQEIVARGVRNSVGFDWHPDTAAFYFNDNGRDLLGADSPADELNQVSSKGEHFGFPYCHGSDVADEKYGRLKACAKFTAPAWQYSAHSAPLGMHFYRGTQFPAGYRKQLFVAQHGSRDMTLKRGYQVVMLEFKNGKPVAETVFASGWLQKNGTVLGRPVDILELNDGSLLVSDDKLGVIYRIAYTGQ